jgi:hypothetical protein
VSHQLLFETAGKDNYERNSGNFWVFEGLGTYFETVEPQSDGTLHVGGMVGRRLEVAYQRIIDGREYVPLAHFVTMSETVFARNEGKTDVFLHYAEANALAVFFMQFDRGHYRDDFLDYVGHAYRGHLGRGSAHALDAVLGVPYSKLDQQFLAFLKEFGPAPAPSQK